MSENRRGQVLYLSHGGGPLPLLQDPSHQSLVDFLKKIPARLSRPEAIVVISAHWEEKETTVSGGANPGLLYDYYGFPQKSYSFTYPAPGNPALAKKIMDLFAEAGIASHLDEKRGFDHGLFVPLKLMYPDSDIPCVQVSLIHNLDSSKHLSLGKALSSLLSEPVLVIGSGFSFHNMNSFLWEGGKREDFKNDAFQEWLLEACVKNPTQKGRELLLSNWEQAPFARYCHPREEHLLPLLVCLSLAGEQAEVVFDDYILGKRSLAFLWE
jgi:aromatic ring-opening dioxygenase catalytic subunit (LigB family)